MKITIKDIAEKAGVSTTTVSHILNNKGSRFSEDTRQRVLKVVDELNYQPDFFAQNMIMKKSRTIGMIVPDVTDLFFSKLIEGVESYFNSLGYMIILCNSKHDPKLEEKYFQQLVYRSVEGIIIATPNILSEKILKADAVVRRHIPLVLIDMGKNPREQGKLLVEEYQGVYSGVKYFIEMGHQKIAFIQEVGDYYQLSERITGYLNCLEDYHIDYNPQLISEGPLTMQGGYQATKQVISQSQGDFTAIFCSNDQMAVGAYQALLEANLRVPDDVSVIGFDGLEIARYMAPALTTVYQPTFDIGFYAAKFILDAIENPKQRIPNKIFETELLVRDSVKRLTN